MRHVLALLLVVAFLPGGCGPCAQVQCSGSLSLGNSPDGQIPGALEATADQFLGEGIAAPKTEPEPERAGTIRLGRDTLSPDSDTPHEKTLSRRIAWRNEVSTELLPEVRGVASLTTAVAQSRYHLPEGLGVLADPTEIGFTAISVDPALGLVWTPRLDLPEGAQLQVGVAAGREVARMRTTVRSALLDVTNYSTQTQGYVELGLGLALPPPHPGDVGVALALTGRRYGRDAVVLGGAVRLSR